MNIIDVLKNELAKPSHIVKVTNNETGFKLQKETSLMRYAYSLADILEEFETIENFIHYLQQEGFNNTTFLIQRTYGSPKDATYHTMKEETVNLQQQNINNSINPAMYSEAPTPNNQTQTPEFLANPLAGNSAQFLGAMVQAERASDYKKLNDKYEEDIKDYRSKIRRLEEENHGLKLKVETAEERADLKVQTELLNKKSVLESDGFQKLAEGLGGLIPHIPAFLGKSANAPAGLGAPAEDLSPMLLQTIELLKTQTDDTVAFIAYVLQNMDDSLVAVLNNHIQNK